MLKPIFIASFLLSAVSSYAQKTDSIYVAPHKEGWAVRHKVKPGEDIFTLSRRYYAPPAMVADANSMNFQQKLTPGGYVIVPLGAYNFLNAKPATKDARPLYMRAGAEPLYKIARKAGVTQRQLQEWNQLATTELRKDQILMVGWLRYDLTNVYNTPAAQSKPKTSGIRIEEDDPMHRRRNGSTVETVYIPVPDTVAKVVDTLSEGEHQFLAQTQNASTVEEKGSAAFFPRAGRSENGIYFAFHNTARRGTIIKIHNPGTAKTVYAKVIGKIPTRDIFHNTILAISSDAKAELETGGEKVWCEIFYAP